MRENFEEEVVSSQKGWKYFNYDCMRLITIGPAYKYFCVAEIYLLDFKVAPTSVWLSIDTPSDKEIKPVEFKQIYTGAAEKYNVVLDAVIWDEMMKQTHHVTSALDGVIKAGSTI